MPRRSKVDEMKYQNALRQKKHRAKQKALKEKNAFYTKCHASPGSDHVASPISSSYHYVMGYVFNQFEDQYRENYGEELPNCFHDSLLSADEHDDEVYVIRYFYEGIEFDHGLPEDVDEKYIFNLLYPSLVDCVEILVEVSELVFKSKNDLDVRIEEYEERFRLRMSEDRINPETIKKMEERELISRAVVFYIRIEIKHYFYNNGDAIPTVSASLGLFPHPRSLARLGFYQSPDVADVDYSNRRTSR